MTSLLSRINVLLVALTLAVCSTAFAAGETSAPLRIVDRLLTASVSKDRMATAPIDTVMLHFCSDVIKNPQDPFNLDRIVEVFETVGVSAHYLIQRDGTVYRFVPEEKVAYHAGKGHIKDKPERFNKLNEYSIGIEMMNVGSASDMKIFMKPQTYAEYAAKYPQNIGFTDAQYTALKQLLDQIASRHPEIKMDRKHIIGHDEYAGSRRTDPGETFDWTRIGLEK